MIEEPRESAPVERTDAPTVHDRTGAEIGVVQGEVHGEAVAMAEVIVPLPVNYHDVTPEIIDRCSPLDLIHYSTQAQAARDWHATVIFQDALVKLRPGNARAHLFLAIALERAGRFADAFVVWEHTITLPTYEPDPRDAIRSVRLREKMTGARSASVRDARPVRHDLPSSHMQVTPEMLELCGNLDLVRYSIQAQKDNMWDRVEMFQWELVKRQPQNIIAHIQLARALVNQGKMEDAAGLMSIIEELQSPHDDQKVTAAILGLRRRLEETASAAALARTRSTRSSGPAAANASPAFSQNPAPLAAPDAAPALRKSSNIDISRFDHFLASIQREAANWAQVQGRGDGWRQVPEEEREFFTEAFAEFKKQLARVIENGPHRAFWGKFNDIELQFQRGALNVYALVTLIERAENAAGGAEVDFGRLEPIRLKVRSVGPQAL